MKKSIIKKNNVFSRSMEMILAHLSLWLSLGAFVFFVFFNNLRGGGVLLSAVIIVSLLFVTYLKGQKRVRIDNYKNLVSKSDAKSLKFADIMSYIDDDYYQEMITILEKHMLSKYSSSLNAQQAEIFRLQSDINPHFLYNILESIRGVAYENNVPEIATIMETIANYYRYSISRRGNIVTLGDELKNITDYFDILKFRFGDRFKFRLICQYPSAYECRVPKLLLQPIIENAIIHGLEPKVEGGMVNVLVTMTETRLVLNVIDTGIGIVPHRLNAINQVLGDYDINLNKIEADLGSRSSIGLQNIQARIRLTYGDEFGLNIASVVDNGTDVEIAIPIIVNPDFEGKYISM